jgi:hypothetical protein
VEVESPIHGGQKLQTYIYIKTYKCPVSSLEQQQAALDLSTKLTKTSNNSRKAKHIQKNMTTTTDRIQKK